VGRLKKLGDKKWKIIIELGEDENGKRRRKTKTVNLPHSEAKEYMKDMEDKLLKQKGLNNQIKLKDHLLEWIKTHSKKLSPLEVPPLN